MEIGARVRYIRIDNEDDRASGYYPPVGTLGTVMDKDELGVYIMWDSGTKGDGEWWCDFEGIKIDNGYPMDIMKCVRQHLGFDEDYDSLDDEINAMSQDEVFEIVCNWNGLIHYADKIKSWVNGIYQTNI